MAWSIQWHEACDSAHSYSHQVVAGAAPSSPMCLCAAVARYRVRCSMLIGNNPSCLLTCCALAAGSSTIGPTCARLPSEGSLLRWLLRAAPPAEPKMLLAGAIRPGSPGASAPLAAASSCGQLGLLTLPASSGAAAAAAASASFRGASRLSLQRRGKGCVSVLGGGQWGCLDEQNVC